MSGPSPAILEVLADPGALARRVAEWMAERLAATEGPVAVALSGGSTPRMLYEQLGAPPCRDRMPWARTHWFWGDERCVPHADARSNYRVAREALLSRAPIPDANVHPIQTDDITPQASAEAYQRALIAFHGSARLDPARPFFHVTLLGLGADGHTASLFPFSPVLAERGRWVEAAVGPNAEARVTLTYTLLESSANVAFLVAGADKRAIFARLRDGDRALPAARLRPAGILWFFADTAAADRG
jgi:6-phosphogluconolactonase